MLDSGEALARAQAEAALADFGDDGFREGLDRTLAALAELPLTEAARADYDHRVTRDLANRLRIEDWCKRHPEIESETLDSPLLVCGLPRTGTTATVAMLALDDRLRYLRGWEAMAPVPPPVAGQEEADPRRLAAIERGKSYPDRALHLFDPDGPEEDFIMLMGLNQHNSYMTLPMPESHMRWWMAEDFAPTYAYHARALKLLQSRRGPNRWLLKAPVHLFHLDVFAAQHPTACFVWTHRDPAKVISSVASLFHRHHARQCVEGAVTKEATGARAMWLWTEGMKRALAARDRIGEDRFIDVHNEDVVRDPIGSFETLYAGLGMEIGADLRARLEAYHAAKAVGTFGEHAHAPDDFGLTREGIRAAFADYIARFGL